jgi:hypothetical protein
MPPFLYSGRGKRKSDYVKFAILALTAKLTQTVPRAPAAEANPDTPASRDFHSNADRGWHLKACCENDIFVCL